MIRPSVDKSGVRRVSDARPFMKIDGDHLIVPWYTDQKARAFDGKVWALVGWVPEHRCTVYDLAVAQEWEDVERGQGWLRVPWYLEDARLQHRGTLYVRERWDPALKVTWYTVWEAEISVFFRGRDKHLSLNWECDDQVVVHKYARYLRVGRLCGEWRTVYVLSSHEPSSFERFNDDQLAELE